MRQTILGGTAQGNPENFNHGTRVYHGHLQMKVEWQRQRNYAVGQ